MSVCYIVEAACWLQGNSVKFMPNFREQYAIAKTSAGPKRCGSNTYRTVTFNLTYPRTIWIPLALDSMYLEDRYDRPLGIRTILRWVIVTYPRRSAGCKGHSVKSQPSVHEQYAIEKSSGWPEEMWTEQMSHGDVWLDTCQDYVDHIDIGIVV